MQSSFADSKIPVLFLLMEFAPVNTTGSFRSIKLIKYISQFGIDPIVITFETNQAASFFNAKVDNDLLKQMPSDLKIYQISCDPLKNYKNKFFQFLKIYFSTEDELAKRWKKSLYKALPEILDKHKPKAVFTSLPPFSCGKLASEIAIKYKIPLFLDMRDLWAGWSSTPKNSYFHFLNVLRKEKYIFSTAKKIIGVTPQLIDTFNKLHGNKFREKFVFIPNGFDTPLTNIIPFKSQVNKEINIGYVGSFYYSPKTKEVNRLISKISLKEIIKYQPIKEDWLYRSPYFFFKAIFELFKINPYYKAVIKIHFVGHIHNWLLKMVENFDLKENVHFHGFVTSNKSLEIQKSFNYFLATSEKVINGEHYCLPSKIFDYVGASKPILAFVTDGIQKEFIDKSNLGKTFDINNSKRAAQQLDEFFKNENSFNPNEEYLKQFHRKVIASNIASVLVDSID